MNGRNDELPAACSGAARSLLVFLLLLVFGISACGDEISPEERIKNLIKEVKQAAVERDIALIKKHIARDYRDMKGRGYDEIRSLLAYHFFRTQNLSLFVISPEITVEGERATVLMDVVMVNRRDIESLSDLIPDEFTVYRFDVKLEKRSGRWLVKAADWRPAGRDPF